MFLVIFASLDKGAHLSTSRGGIPYDDFFVPGNPRLRHHRDDVRQHGDLTAILRDEGVLKRMQGTPLPRWAYVAARIGSTVLIVGPMTIAGARARRDRLWRSHSGRHASRSDRHADPWHGRVHDARDRHHPVHPQRRVCACVRQPVDPAADVHLEHLVPDRHHAARAKAIAKLFPIHALADGLQYVFDPRTNGGGLKGQDIRTLVIWTVIGIWLMVRFLRQPQGEAS